MSNFNKVCRSGNTLIDCYVPDFPKDDPKVLSMKQIIAQNKKLMFGKKIKRAQREKGD